jgi:tetraacyldisaccharide 4'-kinase
VRAALGALFAALAGLRVAAYRRGFLPRARLAGPVVSVGNLSVGGSGKTPVVLRVAGILREEGHAVAVLSRGYGGSFRGEALLVGDGSRLLADADAAGDEPVMLAEALPGVVVAVGPRRDSVGRFVEARFGPRVHVLDDGFQHLRLARDLDVVCLDAHDLDDRPLPAGRLRERPSALDRADVVLVTRLEAASEDRLRRLEDELGPGRTHRVARRVDGWRTPDGQAVPAPRRVFLVAGIARPERLAHDAAASGAEVVGSAFFADHHRYRRREIDALSARARAAGADALGTTAKDLPRLRASLPDVSPLPVLVLHVSAAIADEARFRARLLAAVGRPA